MAYRRKGRSRRRTTRRKGRRTRTLRGRPIRIGYRS